MDTNPPAVCSQGGARVESRTQGEGGLGPRRGGVCGHRARSLQLLGRHPSPSNDDGHQGQASDAKRP